jgi:hypothetical protein
VQTPSTAHSASQTLREWIKGEGIRPVDPHSPTLCFPTLILLDSSSAIQASATACCHGIQPPTFPTLLTGRLRGAKAGAQMAGTGYDSWLRSGILLLTNLRLREFIFFSYYATVGLMPSIPSSLRSWSSMGSNFSTCRRTPSFWWRSSSTYVRCSLACDCQPPFSGCST